MDKSTNGERLARLETNMTNMKQEFVDMKNEFATMKSDFGGKLGDIYIALLGDGKQNLGALSRIKTLEDLQTTKEKFNGWKDRIFYLIIALLGTLSGYLILF